MTNTKTGASPRCRTLAAINAEQIPPATPLLGAWLTDRHLAMLFADAGVGKSMFALSVALAVAGGGTLFERWNAPTPSRVLIVDGEMDTRDYQERSRMLSSTIPGLSTEEAFANIKVMARLDQPGGDFINIAQPDGRTKVVDAAKAWKPALVILDNYSTLAEVDDENASASFDGVQNLMLDLKALGACVILVHHTNKSGGFRGTSKMTAVMNSTVKLGKPTGSSGTGGTHFTLSFDKFRGKKDASTAEGFTAALKETGIGQFKWEIENAELDKVHAVVELNQSGDYDTDNAIAEAMGLHRSTVSRLRSKAISSGLIDARDWQNNLQIGKQRVRAGLIPAHSWPLECPTDDIENMNL
jgi:RecA-family ATPase